MERRLLTLLAETPVHAGGPESLAAVDLPIQREAATGLPVIWGQSLKGALRQAWRDARGDARGDAGVAEEEAVFGSRPPRRSESASKSIKSSENSENSENSDDVDDDADDDADSAAGDDAVSAALTKGAISVGDAQLVLFPAATLRQVFGWVSAPVLLSRLARKLRLVGADPGAALTVALPQGGGLGTDAWAGTQVIGPFADNIRADGRAGILGALLAGLVCPEPAAFGFTRTKMTTDTLIVEDSTITGLTKMGTDVVARVQLGQQTKTVVHGPFYSEHLPAETVLAALLAGPGEHLDRLAALLDGQPLQLGGDETVGKGVLWCRVHSAATATPIVERAAQHSGSGSVPPPPAPPAPPASPVPHAPAAPAQGPRPPAERQQGDRVTPSTMPRRKRG